MIWLDIQNDNKDANEEEEEEDLKAVNVLLTWKLSVIQKCQTINSLIMQNIAMKSSKKY